MGEKTGIAWTTHTFNPHLGCQRVSPACGGAKGEGGCYAEALVTGRMGYNPTSADPRRRMKVWGPTATSVRVRTSPTNWRKPLAWSKAAQAEGVRHRVFCASLADVFEDHPDLPAVRADLWPLIESCDGLDWQLLTKRPENIRAMVPPSWLLPSGWPKHVWVGTTVESQKYADERIPHLLAVPAAVRFLSMEPLLSDVLLDDRWLRGSFLGCPAETQDPETDECIGCTGGPNDYKSHDKCYALRGPRIHQVILGGESGPGARPFDAAWARGIIRQCRRANVAAFFKQMGDNPIDSDVVDVFGPDGLVHYTRPAGHPDVAEALAAGGYSTRPRKLKFSAHHGADPSQWPEEFRVQQFPKVVTP